MRRASAISLFLLLAACGSGGDGGGAGAAADPASDAPCDTVFVFDVPAPPASVLEVLRGADLLPKEMRFSTSGAADGTTGGGLVPSSFEMATRQLEQMEETMGVEPRIVGVRIAGVRDEAALGDLAEDVHTRALVPEDAPAAITSPKVDGEPVEFRGDAAACAGAG